MVAPDYLQPELARIDAKIAETRLLLVDANLTVMAQQEIVNLEKEKEMLLASANETGLTNSSNSQSSEAARLEAGGLSDSRGVILEVSGAAGGQEAKIWAQDLLRMYSRFALAQKWEVEPLDEKTLLIRGRGAFEKLQFETGVHRVQRVPTTESSGRVHTSTATVSALPELKDIDIYVNPDDLQWDFFRSGGHGGQNVNKVSTAVRLCYKPLNLIVTCQTERYQGRNREIALEMLRGKLWEIEEEKRLSESSAEKKSQVGRGMRSEKIRTYNFLQDRVTDHRLNKDFHNLEQILDGKLDAMINDLINYTDK